MRNLLLTILTVLLAFESFAQSGDKRIALIIGNAAYENGGALKNPVNDANLMATTLKGLGFEVILKTNANLKAMQMATVDFTNKIANYDVALFFYAGHGIQLDGENYLVPVDAQLNDKVACQFEAFNVNFINRAFQENQKHLNVMILDACRNNPFRSWMRGGNRGFQAVKNQAAGTIIAFATREGETASDGSGNNGLFTEKLVKQMNKAQNITEVFQNTRVEVLKASENSQCPQEWNMLTGNFSFKQGASNVTNNNENNTQPEDVVFNPGNVEILYGSISVDTEISGDLYLDGKKIGYVNANSKDNKLNKITTGSHKIEIRGSENFEQSATVGQNQTAYITAKSSNQSESSFKLNADFEVAGIKLRGIEGGTFTMGSNKNDDESIHYVQVSNFGMMKYEVTIAEYMKFVNETNSHYPKWLEQGSSNNIQGSTTNINNYKENRMSLSNTNYPITGVSWKNAVAFSEWLSLKTGQTWRLPTEAEWEYAARGGQNYNYAGSDKIENVAWYSGNRKGKTQPIGLKSPNSFGLYDMTGNVWEWCSDWYDAAYYKNSPTDNPQGPSAGSYRVSRGGSWNNNASYCRIANRDSYSPDARNIYLGFRLVLVP